MGFVTLRREPGYTTLVITLMALGIAATTTLVSVTSGVLLKPLPWPEPERLVRLEERREGRSGRVPWTISNGTYLAWREGPSSTVEEIGGWSWAQSTFRGAGDPERIRIARITPSAFSVVKARPAMGRLFTRRRRRQSCDDNDRHPFSCILAAALQRSGGCGRPHHPTRRAAVHDRGRHACGLRISRSRDAGVDSAADTARLERRGKAALRVHFLRAGEDASGSDA